MFKSLTPIEDYISLMEKEDGAKKLTEYLVDYGINGICIIRNQ